MKATDTELWVEYDEYGRAVIRPDSVLYGARPEDVGKQSAPGWKVAMIDPQDGRVMHLRMIFFREIDANMAKAALERAGLGCVRELIKTTADERERIMAEALQW
jgi:hypothetical protein